MEGKVFPPLTCFPYSILSDENVLDLWYFRRFLCLCKFGGPGVFRADKRAVTENLDVVGVARPKLPIINVGRQRPTVEFPVRRIRN